jgi:2-oxoglutarate ferredoxin oxidoreductase subunit beta
VVHDESAANGGLAFFLSQLEQPDFPVPLGVFRDIDEPAYETLNQELHAKTRAAKGKGDLAKLLNSGNVWTI